MEHGSDRISNAPVTTVLSLPEAVTDIQAYQGFFGVSFDSDKQKILRDGRASIV